MSASRHLLERELALYATGDMNWWRLLASRLHVSRCPICSDRAAAFQHDQMRVADFGEQMPASVNWDRMSSEMIANIRVGLAAGECVAPRVRRRSVPTGWRVAGVAAAFGALLIGAWWLNVPGSQTASIGRAVKAITNRGWDRAPANLFDEQDSLVEATAAGIEIRGSNGALGVSSVKGARPVSVSLSAQGSARARYIDSDTGQVTITSVYAE